MTNQKYSLTQISTVLKEEEIGRHSSRYILDRLGKIPAPAPDLDLAEGKVTGKVKPMPTYSGVPVTPSANNNVTFEHKGERCQLHFLTNGNLAISRDSNKETYLEVNKDELMNFLMSKF